MTVAEAAPTIVIGFVAAMRAEARWLTKGRRRLPFVPRVVREGRDVAWRVEHDVRIAGIGADAARRTAEALVARGAHALVSWGAAAGLDRSTPAGTIVVSHSVVWDGGGAESHDQAVNALLMGLTGEVPSFTGGIIACVDRVLRTPEDKRAVAERYGAVAADMESRGVVEVAVRAGVPWVAVRVITDGAADTLPSSVLSAIDDSGGVRGGRVLAGVMRRPAELPALIALGRAFRGLGPVMQIAAARASTAMTVALRYPE